MSEWISHDGGKCYLEDGTLVYVVLRSSHAAYLVIGEPSPVRAFWVNNGDMDDIIAYKIIANKNYQSTIPNNWSEQHDRN